MSKSIVESRHEELYHGYKLIINHWKGKIQGRAFYGVSNWSNENTISAEGSSIIDVLTILKTLVDSQNSHDKRDTEALHQIYLSSNGRPSQFCSDEGFPRNPPNWHCYRCQSKFTEFMGHLCLGCRTEVCPHCGACHCGYLGYK